MFVSSKKGKCKNWPHFQRCWIFLTETTGSNQFQRHTLPEFCQTFHCACVVKDTISRNERKTGGRWQNVFKRKSHCMTLPFCTNAGLQTAPHQKHCLKYCDYRLTCCGHSVIKTSSDKSLTHDRCKQSLLDFLSVSYLSLTFQQHSELAYSKF